MQVLFFLVFTLFSFGQIGRVSFLGQQVNLYLYEVILGFILFYLFLKLKAEPVKKALVKYKFIILFFAVLSMSIFFSLKNFSKIDNIIALLYLLRLLFYSLVFFYIDFYYLSNKKFKILTEKYFYLMIIFTVLTSTIQYFLYPDLRNLIYLGWDDHYYRSFGVFLDTGVTASIYSLILIFLIKRISIKHNLLLNLILSFVYLLLVLLTYSRSLYLVGIILLGYFLIKSKKFIILAGFILVFISFILFFPKQSGEGVNLTRAYSIFSRFDDIKTGINIWKGHPFFGIGYNHIRPVKKKLGLINVKEADINHAGSSFHSSFVIILVCAGIFGLIAFLLALGNIYYTHRSSAPYIFLVLLLSLSDNIILHPFILFLVIFLINDR